VFYVKSDNSSCRYRVGLRLAFRAAWLLKICNRVRDDEVTAVRIRLGLPVSSRVFLPVREIVDCQIHEVLNVQKD